MGGVLRVQFDKDGRVAPEVGPAAAAEPLLNVEYWSPLILDWGAGGHVQC